MLNILVAFCVRYFLSGYVTDLSTLILITTTQSVSLSFIFKELFDYYLNLWIGPKNFLGLDITNSTEELNNNSKLKRDIDDLINKKENNNIDKGKQIEKGPAIGNKTKHQMITQEVLKEIDKRLPPSLDWEDKVFKPGESSRDPSARYILKGNKYEKTNESRILTNLDPRNKTSLQNNSKISNLSNRQQLSIEKVRKQVRFSQNLEQIKQIPNREDLIDYKRQLDLDNKRIKDTREKIQIMEKMLEPGYTKDNPIEVQDDTFEIRPSSNTYQYNETINPALLSTSNNLDWSPIPNEIEQDIRLPENREESNIPLYIDGYRVLQSWEIIRESDFAYQLYKDSEPRSLERISNVGDKENIYRIIKKENENVMIPIHTPTFEPGYGALYNYQWDWLIEEWDRNNKFMFDPETKLKVRNAYVEYIQKQKELVGIKSGPIPPEVEKSMIISKPKRLIIDAFANMVLHPSSYTYPNWSVFGPQPALNLTKIPPHNLLPGYYSNDLTMGTVIPTLPSMYLNPKYMSTDQLNYVVSYITWSQLFNKEIFLIDNSHLEGMYDQLYMYCRSVLAEVSERHVLFCKYRYTGASEEDMQALRVLQALDHYWDELRREHGHNLFNNYKPYHSEYKPHSWKYHGEESNRFYLKSIFTKLREKRYPISVPPWKKIHD
jgi:hypothetical protein